MRKLSMKLTLRSKNDNDFVVSNYRIVLPAENERRSNVPPK